MEVPTVAAVQVPSTMPSRLLRITNAISYAVLVFVNAAAGMGLFGDDNATISKHYHTPLTPAGWAFSIWGLIFLLQGVGVVWALLPHGYTADGSKQRVVNAIGYRWQLGWAAECAWQLSFAQQDTPGMWACLAFLVAGLAAFASALRRLIALRDDYAVPQASALLYTAYLLPTTVNTAWLSVASCLGGLVLARSMGATEAALVLPSVLLALLVTCVGAFYVYASRDTAYGLTLVWALLAVFGRQPGQTPAMRWTSFVGVVVMSVMSVGSVLRRRPPPRDDRDPREAAGGSKEPLWVGGLRTGP